MKNMYIGWSMKELQVAIEDLEQRLKILKQAQAVLEQPLPNVGKGKPIHLESEDIEKIILTMDGNFSAQKIPAAINREYPQKVYYSKNAIPSALYKLVAKEKAIEYVSKRKGRTPATYRVIKR
jgi:hypothetical protein